MAEEPLAELAAAATADPLLDWETTHGKTERFDGLDQLVADSLAAEWQGRDIVAIHKDPAGRRYKDRVEATQLPPEQQHLLHQQYAVDEQQRRGAWYIPDELSLKPWASTLPITLNAQPRQALTLAHDVTAGTDTATNTPAAVWLWSTVEPVLELLVRPLTLWAGERAPLRSREEAETAWTSTVEDLRRLNIGLDELAQPFAPQRWASRSRGEQQRARETYLAGLRSIDPAELARRTRALRVQKLLAVLAKKTKGKPQAPLARTALTKAHQPTLSAYFGGHWLSLLDYTGLQAHPSEEVITALPEPALLVNTGQDSVSTIAQAQNLATDDVEAILAAYLGTKPRQQSPIDERLTALQRWWDAFDNIHAKQEPGMPELWGLVDDGLPLVTVSNPRRGAARQYRALLPHDITVEVDRLWDGLTLPQWPENIVSEPHPHRLMAEAIGPAARFWHGVALTAWYETEDGYSRNTLDEVADAHRADLAALDELGCSVDSALFDDLIAVQKTFGEPREVRGTMTTRSLGNGIAVEHWTGSWGRREGFERARDVITRHRRVWASAHLPDYLAARWRQDLSQAVHRYHKHLAAKGKPPTFKQFSRIAASAANRWFNGDLSGIYRAMGESAPHTPRRVDQLPVDAYEFAVAVYVGLGGEFVDDSYEAITAYGDGYDRLWSLATLANKSIYYVQLCEAMGERPEPKRVVREDIWSMIWPGGLEEGWPAFTQYVDDLRTAAPEDFPDAASLMASATAEAPASPDPRQPDGQNIVRVSFGSGFIAPNWRAPDTAGYSYYTGPDLQLSVGDRVLVPTEHPDQPEVATVIALTRGASEYDGPLATLIGRAPN